MGKEDTFHFQDDRIRIPFRDMTTSEAEYHAETMWPYYDEKITYLIDRKAKLICTDYGEEIFINQTRNILGINLEDQLERDNLRRILNFLRFISSTQKKCVGIFYKIFVPWLIAACTGFVIILITFGFSPSQFRFSYYFCR